MKNWEILPDKITIQRTIKALEKNGIGTFFFHDREELKKKLAEIIPNNAEVFTMTSVTLDALGISEEINESGNYNSIRKKFMTMDSKTQKREMRQYGAAPDFAIGSVHAITEDGKIIIASNTGSQLPAYAYGAGKVIFVIGAQKIVKNIDEGIKRVYEHSLQLESERAKKAYGVPGSSVNKLLIINKEVQKERITVLLLNEVLGF